MQGYITTRDVLLHPVMIIRELGPRVYARCLVRIVRGWAVRDRVVTFLECL